MPGRTPGAVYPQKTTPFYSGDHPNGLGIVQPVNTERPPMSPVSGHVAALKSTFPMMDARAAAANQVYHGATKSAQEALNRRGLMGDVQAHLRENRGLVQNRTPQHGNPVAMENKVGAEKAMDAASDAVIKSPQIGDSSPKLIIPKWENRPKRSRPGIGSE